MPQTLNPKPLNPKTWGLGFTGYRVECRIQAAEPRGSRFSAFRHDMGLRASGCSSCSRVPDPGNAMAQANMWIIRLTLTSTLEESSSSK